MPALQQRSQELPLPIVGSTKFGRYPKISNEQTFNMLVSDGALVNYAGYKAVANIETGAGVVGRDIYSSVKANLMIAVVGNKVYSIDPALNVTFIGSIAQNSGNIFMAENNSNQIGITDGLNLYLVTYGSGVPTLTTATLSTPFNPGYITFQNNRFVIASNGTNQWILGPLGSSTTIATTSQTQGFLQTKPDNVQGVLRFPGRGNLLFVFGNTVTEAWQDVGNVLFPYQRNSAFNVDYGCISPNTIAENEDIVVWLAGNEQSGPAIMMSNGTDIKKISTDGIDFKFSQLTNPANSFGFLFRQDGHVIYQITFPDDNLTYAYDFNTDKFFTITDEDLNYHPAKRVVFFNNKYYFVSLNDGNLYEFGTEFTNYEYLNNVVYEIPRIRITPPFRLPNQKWFIGRSCGFAIENGQPNTITNVPVVIRGNGKNLITENNSGIYGGNDIAEEGLLNDIVTEDAVELDYQLSNMAIDLSISRDGAETFGSSVRYNLNPTGVRKSMVLFQRLGIVNDITMQFRFWGLQRFVAFDGLLEVYQ